MRPTADPPAAEHGDATRRSLAVAAGWEAALTLPAFGTAASVSRDVPAALVRGAVGDGPGLELLAHLDGAGATSSP